MVPGVNTNGQFSVKNKTIIELAGSRSVSQECLLNVGAGDGKYLTSGLFYICMGKKPNCLLHNKM